MEVDGTVGMESPESQNDEGGQASVVERSSEVIRNLIDRLSEGGRPEHRAAWESVQDPDVINMMVEAWLTDETQMLTNLTMIEMVPRQVQRARQYRRTI